MAVVRKSTNLTPAEFRFLRKYLGYSSTDFSKLLDVRKETMSRWERGSVTISPIADRFIRLAVAHNIRVDDYPVEKLKEIHDDGSEPQPFWLSRREGGWFAANTAA
jgi:transcriptional regulator with XRE-family HTH domain